MNTLAYASVKELSNKIRTKEISVNELVHFFIKRFEAFDPDIGSALEIFGAESIIASLSSALDETHSLYGIPGILKDNICQKDRITSCASKILEHFVAPYDATAAERLKHVGALLIGRANMDEFAMGSSTENSAYKKTKNPWNRMRVPGGSSGGSAAAVAAGLVPWALGSDTGGSVRQPASFCGIVGLKPTYGLVSRYGLVAYSSSLDQIGVFTRTVEDNAIVLSAIAGVDAHDSTTLAVDKKDYAAQLAPSLPQGLRIGVVTNALHAQGMDAEITASIQGAIEQLQSLGAQVSEVALPTLEYTTSAYFIISRAEAASNLARFDGVRYGLRDKTAKSLAQMYSSTRHDGFGTDVKSRIIVGNYVLSAGHAGEFYINAKRVQHLIRHEFIETFKNVDLLVMPTNPTPAFELGAFDMDRLQLDLQDYFTCSMNLAGIPALSLPCGQTKSGLPIGFQLVGPHLSEQLLYRVAHVYEQNTSWHTLHPKDC